MKKDTVILTSIVLLIVDRIAINNPPKIYYSKNLLFGHNAMTIAPIGIFIKESEKENAALLQHELIHWEQYCSRGMFLFYLDYLLGLLHNGYDLHPMELEARSNENDFSKYNYTYAVRNGLANTIFDPNFRT